MAATIKIKNSSTTGAVPTSSDLVQGELAVNVADLGLYTENASGTVVKLNAPSIDDKNTGATKHLTISTGGNLGLGVTPSAWGGTTKNIEGGSGSLNFYSTTQLWLTQNAYWDTGGAWKYKANGYATSYQQYSGAHQWFTAASGTAGGSVTYTQAMTLNASGQLIINDTSAGTAKMKVVQSGDNTTAWFTNGSLGTTNPVLFLENYQAGSDSKNLIAGDNNTGTVFKVTTNGGGYYAGNLLVGTTTSPDSNLTGVGISSAIGKWALAISAYNRGYVYSATTDGYPAFFVQGGSTVGYIATTSTTTTYATSSDYRLKNSIAPMTGALAKVAALKPVTYKWNANGSDGEGFIAHELAEVCPNAVTGAKDAVDEDGNPVYQGIDTSFLVATLTAAIQELKAEFDAYKASHP